MGRNILDPKYTFGTSKHLMNVIFHVNQRFLKVRPDLSGEIPCEPTKEIVGEPNFLSVTPEKVCECMNVICFRTPCITIGNVDGMLWIRCYSNFPVPQT